MLCHPKGANMTVEITLKTVSEELREIYNNSHGILKPQNVLDYAKNKNTALHRKFEWDDRVAGEKYRLWQARQIISYEVEITPADSEGPIDLYIATKENQKQRTYQSLSIDRAEDNGYRHIDDIMDNDYFKEQLFDDFKQDANRLRTKYQRLQRLDSVFHAIDKVVSKAA